MEKQASHISMQHLIGNLLRIGVIVAASIVAWGGFWYLFQHGSQLPALQTFGGEPEYLTQVSGIFKQALQGNSRAIIQAGLLILIFTPVARVVMSVLVFALEKDRLYIFITLIVLGVLLYGLTGDVAL